MTLARSAVISNNDLPAPSEPEEDGQNGREVRIQNAALPDSPTTETGPGHKMADAHTSGAGSASSMEDARAVHSSSEARCDTDDLALLHAALGHYARQLWDIQKTRIMMSNRVGAMERDGLPDGFTLVARSTMEGLDKLEKELNRNLERSARRHFMADWIADQRGIGLPGFARLLGITGPLDRFATVSKLWAYLGMHVVDGAAPKRAKGEKANWSPQGRVLCHQIGDSIVKVGSGGPYRAAYDRKKAQYEAEREDWTQARRHNAAMRYAVKMLLKEMWVEWHRRRPLQS